MSNTYFLLKKKNTLASGLTLMQLTATVLLNIPQLFSLKKCNSSQFVSTSITDAKSIKPQLRYIAFTDIMKVIQLRMLREYTLNMSAEVWDVFIHLLSIISEMEKNNALRKASNSVCTRLIFILSTALN